MGLARNSSAGHYLSVVESQRLGRRLPKNDEFSLRWSKKAVVELEDLLARTETRDEVVQIFDVRRDTFASRLLNRNTISDKAVSERRLRTVWDFSFPLIRVLRMALWRGRWPTLALCWRRWTRLLTAIRSLMRSTARVTSSERTSSPVTILSCTGRLKSQCPPGTTVSQWTRRFTCMAPLSR